MPSTPIMHTGADDKTLTSLSVVLNMELHALNKDAALYVRKAVLALHDEALAMASVMESESFCSVTTHDNITRTYTGAF